MLGRIQGWQRRHWRECTKAERVELHSVVTWQSTTWFFSLCWLLLPLAQGVHRDAASLAAGGLLLGVGMLQCVVAGRLIRPALDHYLGRTRLPLRELRGAAGLLALGLALALLIHTLDWASPVTPRLVIGAVLLPFGLLYGLVVPVRTFLRRAAVLVVLITATFGLGHPDPFGLLVTGGVAAFGAAFALLASRCSAWRLSVLWEAERAREVESRLAVAEERLRFGRDLHDVMGRNLAVIALKSELAVQLARRGQPQAVEQMIEVQRLAQEVQREMREVVRGYREADLGVELLGAKSVLTAAGIACDVSRDAIALPTEAQSALGWVVREATTNVLRHGDAKRCAVQVRAGNERVVLSVENDGAGTAERSSGSGLAGLRERLAAVNGTLEAGMAGENVFLLVAEVPLVAATMNEVTP
ncbi:hypothetical protein GCM10023100_42440 [Actinocorallia cavernae]|uniref:Signal transduction histidine kinase subgroup 3 dimerisation and phosphoacceptor domain-containing protein n=2 Tax=Actinomycetes TaxID=1760 RepID=A0ABP8SUJ6_9ACTN